MTDLFTSAWIADLDRRCRALSFDPEFALTIEQRVVGAKDEFIWHTSVKDGRARVLEGAADGPDIVFRSDAATAEAIVSGEKSAQRAFLDGELTLDGNIGRLIEAVPVLQALRKRA